MSAPAAYRKATALEIRLEVRDGNLHFDAPSGVMTPEIRSALTENKAEIIRFLSNLPAAGAAARECRPADAPAHRVLDGETISAWLRQHAPEVAALWPDAPADAPWIDWRLRVGHEHVEVLDEAYAAITGTALRPQREDRR